MFRNNAAWLCSRRNPPLGIPLKTHERASKVPMVRVITTNQRRAGPMQIKNFKDMYIAELQELANMESQIDIALKRMADASSHPSLKRELLRHRGETKEQSKRLQSILQNHGAKLRAHTDQAMEALVNETQKMLSLLEGDDLRDAGLIASTQKLEHYEIAAYGTAAALAGQLDLRDDQRMLNDSLKEERKAEAPPTEPAKGEVNQDAAAA